jgi:hypothetical protein
MDVLLAPLGLLPPVAGLLLVSVAATTAMLLIVKTTSRRSQVEASKRQIYALLLEMRLFNDDVRAVLRAARELLSHNGAYLRALAVPMIVSSVPLIVLLTHLESFYRTTGLTPGRSGLVAARVRDGVRPDGGAMGGMNASLEVPAGVNLDTAAVWFPATQEFVWQVTPQAPGRFDLIVRVGEQRVSKTMRVSDAVTRRAPSRAPQDWWSEWLAPADQLLPEAGVIASIAIRYPLREIDLFGVRVHWLVLLAVSSLITALVVKRPLGVAL